MPTGHSKVNLTSADLSEEQLGELRRILPEAFAEKKIDFEKLRAVLGDAVDARLEKFGFTWAGKSEAIKSVLMPSKLTLKPQKDESVKFDESENIFIEGDNLEVLKLLQKTYFEKVKMIYIDPPYNTGGDFVYKDNFAAPLKSYKAQTGQTDENGKKLQTNSETNGRFHSDWLSMMYPRLKLAWNLLRDDGVIFVSIDDNEVHRLRMMMDEIFGEENFVGQLIWERAYAPKNDAKYISNSHDYVLMFAKSIGAFDIGRLRRSDEANGRYTNPDDDPRGDWKPSDMSVKTYSASCDYPIETPSGRTVNPPAGRSWSLTKKAFEERVQDNRIWFGRDGNSVPAVKRFLSEVREGITPTSLLFYKDVGHSQEGAQEVKRIFEKTAYFDGPKPVRLLRHLLAIANTGTHDIVVDFFAGSGTTAHAVLTQNVEDGGNRKFICVQLPEQTDKDSEARKAGYKTIADIAKERIRRVIKGYGDKPQPIDDGFKVFKLDQSNYHENEFDFDPERSEEENQEAFKEYLGLVGQDKLFAGVDDIDVVYENVIKEGLSLNANVELLTVEGSKVYHVADDRRELFVCLEQAIPKETVKALCGKEYKEKTLVCIDSALDDSAKANLGLSLELKTI